MPVLASTRSNRSPTLPSLSQKKGPFTERRGFAQLLSRPPESGSTYDGYKTRSVSLLPSSHVSKTSFGDKRPQACMEPSLIKIAPVCHARASHAGGTSSSSIGVGDHPAALAQATVRRTLHIAACDGGQRFWVVPIPAIIHHNF